MTPVWVVLVAAGFGVLGTLGGVVVTQWATSSRDSDAARREEAARTFEQRRTAYVDVLNAVVDLTRQGRSEQDTTSGRRAFRQAMSSVYVYGTVEFTRQTLKMWNIIEEAADKDIYDLTTKQFSVLVELARRDLGVPDGDR